jgi:hypothetical protein
VTTSRVKIYNAWSNRLDVDTRSQTDAHAGRQAGGLTDGQVDRYDIHIKHSFLFIP